MTLRYLTANAAYVFVWGEQIIRLDGWPMFFASRDEAMQAAQERGITVS